MSEFNQQSEKRLREKLQSHEFEFAPEAWGQMEALLDGAAMPSTDHAASDYTPTAGPAAGSGKILWTLLILALMAGGLWTLESTISEHQKQSLKYDPQPSGNDSVENSLTYSDELSQPKQDIHKKREAGLITKNRKAIEEGPAETGRAKPLTEEDPRPGFDPSPRTINKSINGEIQIDEGWVKPGFPLKGSEHQDNHIPAIDPNNPTLNQAAQGRPRGNPRLRLVGRSHFEAFDHLDHLQTNLEEKGIGAEYPFTIHLDEEGRRRTTVEVGVHFGLLSYLASGSGSFAPDISAKMNSRNGRPYLNAGIFLRLGLHRSFALQPEIHFYRYSNQFFLEEKGYSNGTAHVNTWVNSVHFPLKVRFNIGHQFTLFLAPGLSINHYQQGQDISSNASSELLNNARSITQVYRDRLLLPTFEAGFEYQFKDFAMGFSAGGYLEPIVQHRGSSSSNGFGMEHDFQSSGRLLKLYFAYDIFKFERHKMRRHF